ncbi:helix-turn-helix transcriptional regulator [Halostella litorea]|uniref:helix-turn-helix transcriptional regulator n=1 Tax=Halostella litorea TaxID=2528831 RepID=UPI001091B71D|nr:helix-turn-helix domain-containing protein [Halostella litorea]
MTLARGGLAVLGVLLVVACLGTVVSGAPATATEAGIGDVEISGSGAVMTYNDSTYVWTDEPYNLSVAVAGANDSDYRVCADRYRGGNHTSRIGCVANVTGPNATVTFSAAQPATNETERGTVAVVLTNANGTTVDAVNVSTRAITKDGDLDGDGLPNGKEVEQGLNLTDSDVDMDGLSDGAEMENYGTDPTDPDTDGDGLRDGLELQLGTDPTDGATVVKLTAGALVFGVGLIAGWVLYRRRSDEAPGAESEAESDRADDEPLITDEQRVLQLLRENDGRMKQAAIVQETEWSKAKVSRLLSDMTENGEIEKLSIGRENIIHLEGQGPEAAKPPYGE